MTQDEKTKIEEEIVDVLKTVYDPEIPVNIYDLGMTLQDRPARRWHIRYGYDLYFAILSG